ncbi:MAG: FKBP-type peptidyl-prolyl cis-trans isomerase [Bacteroidetes bacterium]|nr:FKBP-type peptidyl-prolyl cis-trans isomerase [Bacteroidota bacterium]MBU1718582.1 FKBP-type peptidyl-prolyl cis-trans isomerase [Bacteroidota bacterium]
MAQKKSKDKNSTVLATYKDTISYLIGFDIGTNFTQNGVDINPDILIIGLKEANGGDSGMFSKEMAAKLIGEYQQKLMQLQQEKQKKAADENKKKADAFLEANKAKEGVVTLPSGLQYLIMTEGNGEHPKATDKVKVHYHGTLVDGSVFDSSVQRGEPVVFPLNGVIAGWTEGVQLMTPGSKYKFFIPPALGYGERPQGPIPPGSVLIFEVEYFGVEN